MEKTIKELLNSIEYNKGTFPKKEIEELIERQEEAVPYLINYLEEFRNNYEEYINEGNYMGHIYVTFLLAQFKEKGLFKIFLELIKLPDEIPFDLYGDSITEDTARILGSAYNSQLDEIKDLIEDSLVNEYVRGQGVHTLSILVLNGILKREEVVEYFKYLLDGGLKDRNTEVITSIVCYASDLHPKECYESIKRCFDKREVSTLTINLKDVERDLKQEKGVIIGRSKGDEHNKFITDVVDFMSWWACFKDDNENKKSNKAMDFDYEEAMKLMKNLNKEEKIKIGRNDPCPCGSGNKYKKCCGK